MAIGYKQPLPSERCIVFRIEYTTPQSREDVVRALCSWAKAIGTDVQEMANEWQKMLT